MTVNSSNHSATEGNPTAETDARIDELRRELAELFALRRRQHPLSARMSPANPTGDTVSPRVPPVSAPGRIARLWRTGRAVLRHLRRSPAALFADVERYFARSGHQPEQWASTAGGRIAVADRLQDVWPLNVEVRDNLPPTLNVLLPSLRKTDLTGGPNTALNLTYRLAARGVPVRYIATDQELDADASFLQAHARAVSGVAADDVAVEFHSGRDRSRPLVIGAGDVLCGTAWWTVQMIKDIQPRLSGERFWYLIQDFEPAMYAWSTRQALALETYSLDCRAIVCGRLLADYLAQERVGRFADAEFVARSAVFEPAVDPRKFYPRFEEAAARKKRLLFYARPQAPRNLFELGLVALRRAVDQGAFAPDEWELGFIGSELPTAELGRGVIVKSHPWRDFDSYASLLQTADVGLSLMLSPHTSYPPLEMAACGATVVTNTYAVKTAERLRQISPNLLPVPPQLDDIVAGLLAAARRADDLPARFAGAVLDVPEDWDAAFDPLMPQLLEMWDECRGR